MVLFSQDTKENAVKRFSEVFHPYFLPGVKISEGINFEFSGADLLVSDKLKKFLNDSFTLGNIEYYTHLHFNFS